MKLELDKIEAERKVVQKHLEDINYKIDEAQQKLLYPLHVRDKVHWLVENSLKDNVDSEKLEEIFNQVADKIRFREGKTLKKYMERLYEGHTSASHIKSCATTSREGWKHTVKASRKRRKKSTSIPSSKRNLKRC